MSTPAACPSEAPPPRGDFQEPPKPLPALPLERCGVAEEGGPAAEGYRENEGAQGDEHNKKANTPPPDN